MRRALALLLALGSTACSRDLALPDASPPRVDEIQLVGLEGTPPPSPLPVLGGELIAIRGAGFRSDATQLEVLVGGEVAEVLSTAEDRIVVRVPALASRGVVDLQARTSVGFRTEEGAVRYDGRGQPEGFDVSDLPTAVPLGFVAPVQPPGSAGFPDLAIATGASDSALLVVPAVGIAATTVPLGLVPWSAAARVVPDGANLRVEVLAVARGGEVALGSAVLDASASVMSRVAARPLAHDVINPTPCSGPQVMFTSGGRPIAAWLGSTGQRIAAIDEGALAADRYAPAVTPPHAMPSEIVGWAPWQVDSVVFATSGPGGNLYVYDAATPAVAPKALTVSPGGLGLPVAVTSLLAAACQGPFDFFYTVTAASSGGSDAIAVSYRSGGVDRVALVQMSGPDAGTVRRGIPGTIPTALSLVPEPPFGSPPAWAVLAAGLSNLFRLRPLAGADACTDLVPDAVLPLSSTLDVLPTFGAMLTTADGTRLLATTPDGDIITVLPPSLTSAGPVFRVAAYGGVSMQRASLGGGELTVAVAEHAYAEGDLSALETGSALLVVSLTDQGAVALGGSGYGRGAVWLDGGVPDGGAIAYTGDLPAAGADAVSERGGAAAVTGFAPGICPGEEVRVTRSRPVAGGPDLVAQGPARAGAFGPESVTRFGPAAPPVYAAKDTSLAVYVPGGGLACLAGAQSWDPTVGCPPDATIELGVAPVDVTLAAGDRAVAARRLDDTACVNAPGFSMACDPLDLLCKRASCPVAKELVVARPAPAAPVTFTLPARPAAVAADRAGGFLVTLPCAASSAAGGDDCFPSSTLCDGLATGPGGVDGALLLVAEDGASAECLAVLPALAGPLAVTPNGAEVWVTADAFGAQILSRLSLARRTTDGAIDATRPAQRLAAEVLGAAAGALGAFPAGGVAFSPDGATGIVTVPGQYRILLYR